MKQDPPREGLIEWASMLCGIGTILSCIYIVAVRSGVFP